MNNKIKVKVTQRGWFRTRTRYFMVYKAFVANGWLSMYVYHAATDSYEELHIPSTNIEGLSIAHTNSIL